MIAFTLLLVLTQAEPRFAQTTPDNHQFQAEVFERDQTAVVQQAGHLLGAEDLEALHLQAPDRPETGAIMLTPVGQTQLGEVVLAESGGRDRYLCRIRRIQNDGTDNLAASMRWCLTFLGAPLSVDVGPPEPVAPGA